ncbi:MAG: hypothetical protein QM708_00935 [Propioniciclava sp.]|uniref:hypothetical protein n=1 Tax=Propioniciclava sp. TaxID=2038686 RepID=UPI0039E4D651
MYDLIMQTEFRRASARPGMAGERSGAAGAGESVPYWQGVSKRRYIPISLAWIMASALLCWILSSEYLPGYPWYSMPLAFAVLFYAFGMSVTERLMLRVPSPGEESSQR